MKTRRTTNPFFFLLPLLIVLLMAIGGIYLSTWIYVVLLIFCPLAAGITWYIYKDMEKKLSDSERGVKH